MLHEQEAFLLETLQGLRITQNTIDELEQLPENHEIILPIGNRAFIKARVQDPSKILIAVGKDIIMEKYLMDARDYTQKMMEGYNEALQQTKERVNQINKKLEELNGALAQRVNTGTMGQDFSPNDA
jgi:prefoldin alpha subunit